VLDEATSALDNVTEHEIAATLGELQGSMTIVIVAHRLSTVRHADTLVFLKDGRVETEGSFDQVRAQNADFARLVELGELG
jgi:ATP-binding cassette, subfamily B, bacterial PglK